jgi:hypothetical protein
LISITDNLYLEEVSEALNRGAYRLSKQESARIPTDGGAIGVPIRHPDHHHGRSFIAGLWKLLRTGNQVSPAISHNVQVGLSETCVVTIPTAVSLDDSAILRSLAFSIMLLTRRLLFLVAPEIFTAGFIPAGDSYLRARPGCCSREIERWPALSCVPGFPPWPRIPASGGGLRRQSEPGILACLQA